MIARSAACAALLAALGAGTFTRRAAAGPWDHEKMWVSMLDVTLRQGEYLGASLVVGHDVLLTPSEVFHRVAVAGRVGVSLGGPSAAAQIMSYEHCPHGLPYCTELALGPKVFRPWWISSWGHDTYVGGEATFGLLLLKGTLGVFRSVSAPGLHWQLGVGLGF